MGRPCAQAARLLRGAHVVLVVTEEAGADLAVRGDPQAAARAAEHTGDRSDDADAPRGRRFCSKCGSALWNYDPRWPELLHPFASAIDSALPVAPQTVHIMLGSKANWVQPCVADGDLEHEEYPEESLADWHARHGIE